MRHRLSICVTKQPVNGGIVACKHISVRERLLQLMFGGKATLTVIVPGDTVQELGICELPEGGEHNEPSETSS